MSINYLSFANDSFLPSFPSPCIVGLYIFFASIFVSAVLLLPLCLFVLYLGLQRWKRQGPVSSAAARNLSDFVTYNMVVMELIGMLGNLIITFHETTTAGVYIWSFLWLGQMTFPVLTCLEHYMAVVHPITYVRLRQEGGIRIRNVSTVFIWLMGFSGVLFTYQLLDHPKYLHIPSIIQLILITIAMTFFSVSVLCILNRPRPGEAAVDRARVDQSKRSAFRIITIIMVTLLVRFGGNIFVGLVSTSVTFSHSVSCVVRPMVHWFNLPSSLVLPLLFLHRAGKLPCCKHKTGSR